MSRTLKAQESSVKNTSETPLSEADFCLYWAMVNDQLIERDEEIERQFASTRQ
jgi:hypothetical protein